jgi:hypothetical protein
MKDGRTDADISGTDFTLDIRRKGKGKTKSRKEVHGYEYMAENGSKQTTALDTSAAAKTCVVVAWLSRMNGCDNGHHRMVTAARRQRDKEE